MSLFFLSSLLPFFLLAKQRSSIATAESVMGAAWGEERLGIAWVSKHHNSKDDRVGVGRGWAGTAEGSHWKRRQRAPKLQIHEYIIGLPYLTAVCDHIICKTPHLTSKSARVINASTHLISLHYLSRAIHIHASAAIQPPPRSSFPTTRTIA